MPLPNNSCNTAKDGDIVIELDRVCKSFGKIKAVDGVTLSIPRGICFALLGPNGAGKTTLMRMIGAVLPRDAGHIDVLGMDPWCDKSEVKAHLGVVMQDNALDEELDVLRNLRIHGLFHWLKGKAFREKTQRLLEFVELNGREKMPIQTLSGGMKRRLVVARALVNEPEILLLDEPTTGLDPQVRHAIWSMLRKLKSGGMTLLLTTHYMSEAAQLADRVGIMDKGRLIAEDTPDGLIEATLPAHVLELDTLENPAALEALADETQIDQHGDRAYVFHDDEEPLRQWIARFGLQTVQLRQSTLEDVFLKMTGRGLDG